MIWASYVTCVTTNMTAKHSCKTTDKMWKDTDMSYVWTACHRLIYIMI